MRLVARNTLISSLSFQTEQLSAFNTESALFLCALRNCIFTTSLYRILSLQKPYACPLSGCNKAYTDPSSQRKHVRTSHSDAHWVELRKIKLALQNEAPENVPM